MARQTRLQAAPARRVHYRQVSDQSLRSNEPVLETTTTDRQSSRRQPGRQGKRGSVPSAAVTTQSPGRVKKKQTPAQVPKSQKTECIICATQRLNTRFVAPEDTPAALCEHLRVTCKPCLGKMVKTMVTGRHLDEASLACPFPDCETTLDFTDLKKIIAKGVFCSWDSALVKYHLSKDADCINCVNLRCGLPFCVADRKEKCPKTKKTECPYCEAAQCLACNRFWRSRHNCDEAKQAENKASEVKLKQMGTNPCPKCGVRIVKDGGCDHMTCMRCRHEFCWQCGAGIGGRGTMEHAENCPLNTPQNIGVQAALDFHAPFNFLNGHFNQLPPPPPPPPQQDQPPPQALPPAPAIAPQDLPPRNAGLIADAVGHRLANEPGLFVRIRNLIAGAGHGGDGAPDT